MAPWGFDWYFGSVAEDHKYERKRKSRSSKAKVAKPMTAKTKVAKPMTAKAKVAKPVVIVTNVVSDKPGMLISTKNEYGGDDVDIIPFGPWLEGTRPEDWVASPDDKAATAGPSLLAPPSASDEGSREIVLDDKLVADLLAGGGTRRMDRLAPDRFQKDLFSGSPLKETTTAAEPPPAIKDVVGSKDALVVAAGKEPSLSNGEVSIPPTLAPTTINNQVIQVARGAAIGFAFAAFVLGGQQLYKWLTTRRDGEAKQLKVAQNVNLETAEATHSRW
jgi:hypothetical protein